MAALETDILPLQCWVC